MRRTIVASLASGLDCLWFRQTRTAGRRRVAVGGMQRRSIDGVSTESGKLGRRECATGVNHIDRACRFLFFRPMATQEDKR